MHRVVPGRLGLVLAALAIAASGCERQGPVAAVGRADDVSVFTNAADEDAVGAEIRRLIAYPVEVVGTDPAFYLEFIPFRRFGTHRVVKNLIFAVDLSASDPLARSVPNMLAGRADALLAARTPFIRVYPDLWAEGQTTLFAVAWSEPELKRLLSGSDSTAVRRAFEESVVTGLTHTMFSLGEDRDLAASLAREHGFTLRLTSGFTAAQHPQGNLVKVNAQSPVRIFMIHWRGGELPLDLATWDPVLREILWVYNDGDVLLDPMTRAFPSTFQARPALKWEGIWQNEKYTIGGPFRAYAVHRDGRSFLLVGIVFAPGEDKVRILRQVEAHLATFRTVT
jgi:hypothetical protein